MRMIRDVSGRFKERPYYPNKELDVECERLVREFLLDKYGRIEWPISTEDLTVLLEQHVEDLDVYADLSVDGPDVEGVTHFFPGRRPRVRISQLLSADHAKNRLRTTLTHELGHVRFHSFLFELAAANLDLFDTGHVAPAVVPAVNQKCHRESMVSTVETDWMEWQAGYACGAYLMPASRLGEVVRLVFKEHRVLEEPTVSSRIGELMIDRVVSEFDVSRDAARVRLIKTGHLLSAPPADPVFK